MMMWAVALSLCAAGCGSEKAEEERAGDGRLEVTVVTDRRCRLNECDPGRFLSFVEESAEGAVVNRLDWGDAAGKALFAASGQRFLPIAVFGREIENEWPLYGRIKKRLATMEDGRRVYPMGRRWSPAGEVCDDGVDNTGDGKVDCDDETCHGDEVCRARE
jgi:hypothetical protein